MMMRPVTASGALGKVGIAAGVTSGAGDALGTGSATDAARGVSVEDGKATVGVGIGALRVGDVVGVDMGDATVATKGKPAVGVPITAA